MSVLPPLDTFTICLASAAFYGIYSTHCSFQRPNPDVSNPTDIDKWNSPLSDAISLLLQYSMPLLGLFHALIILYQLNPPPLICPHPENLQVNLFTWSFRTITTFFLLITFANLRLWTYRALDKDFVYQLTRPSQLVTTGPYKYAQHPSYTTALVCWFTLHASLTRLDGVLGCFLPQNTRLKNWAEVLALGHCAFWALFLGYVIPPRVRDEEVMLKREFDGEWERWSGRTKRFIPGVY